MLKKRIMNREINLINYYKKDIRYRKTTSTIYFENKVILNISKVL